MFQGKFCGDTDLNTNVWPMIRLSTNMQFLTQQLTLLFQTEHQGTICPNKKSFLMLIK